MDRVQVKPSNIWWLLIPMGILGLMLMAPSLGQNMTQASLERCVRETAPRLAPFRADWQNAAAEICKIAVQ